MIKIKFRVVYIARITDTAQFDKDNNAYVHLTVEGVDEADCSLKVHSMFRRNYGNVPILRTVIEDVEPAPGFDPTEPSVFDPRPIGRFSDRFTLGATSPRNGGSK